MGWISGCRVVVVLVLIGAVASLHAQSSSPRAEGSGLPPTVVSVRIISDDGRVLRESPTGIAVETNKPLDRGQVAESLRTLYKSGMYSDLRAISSEVAGGVRLDFVARENLFINQVRIEGLTPPPSDASAAAATQLTLGQIYRVDAINEAKERLRETLQQEGLYTAVITADTWPHPETHQMDVVFRVKAGARARVGALHLKNETEYRDADILSRLKMSEGRQITSARLLRGTDKIRKFLVKKGDLSARAVVRRGAYDAAKNTVALDVDVVEGPRVQVKVTGAKFSKSELKRLVPVFEEGAVDTDLLEEGKRNLRERMERQGYFDCTVDYTTDTHEITQSVKGWKGTEEIITYHVERGEHHKLVGIEVTGNKYFNSELLRSRLQIFGSAFQSRGRFSRRLVDSDALSMRNLYIANGFLEAKVEPRVEDNYKGKPGDLLIRFNIQEGQQTRVASLTLEGVKAFQEDVLLSVVAATAGQPYSDFNVATDRDNILALYFNEGFPDASFTSTADRITPPASPEDRDKKTGVGGDAGKEKEKEKHHEEQNEKSAPNKVPQADPVKLTYRIQEGPQTRVRKILLAGQEHTRTGVIHREVEVKPDAPLRQGEVVESQRRLYNLGIFNRVTIEPQNPTGTALDKDVVVLVEEAKRYTLAYGGGFEVQRLASTSNPVNGQFQAAPRGILELSKLNLTGRADSLSLKLRGSTIEDRALLGYNVPDTFGHQNFSFQATAYTEKTQDINTFTEMRYEGSVQLTQQATPRTTLLYRYVFRKVKISNLANTISPEQIPLFQQPTLVSQFGVTWVRDRRDNPADPTRGTFNSADFGVADHSIGSSASFLRFFFQNSTYYPIKRRFSIARSSRFGMLTPYGNTVSLTFPPPTISPLPVVIPLPERFFAGGGTSLRGFALNQAGPRDAFGFPVGGQAMLILNQEFRFPMRLPVLGTSLGGAIFYDGGNVYSRLSRISFKASLPKPTFDTSDPAHPVCATNCGNELNYFAHTLGFGVRYATPVGPIRVDLGYQLNRPYFSAPCTAVTGNVVPTCFKAAQLPRFQIFFNLGSSF